MYNFFKSIILIFIITQSFIIAQEKVNDKKPISDENKKESAKENKVDLFNPPEFKDVDQPKGNFDNKIKPAPVPRKISSAQKLSLKATIIITEKNSVAVITDNNKEYFLRANEAIQLNEVDYEVKTISKSGIILEAFDKSKKILVK